MSTNERYLAFATPPVISSGDFTTEFIRFEPSGSQRVFTNGDAISISLSNLNKAQFLIPDQCALVFDAFVQVTPAATTVADGSKVDTNQPIRSLDPLPRIAFGSPFFESVNVSVPGSSAFNALPSSATGTAAYWHSTRLLASSCSAVGSKHDRALNFSLGGRYNFAGGKSGLERASGTTGALRKADNTAHVIRGTGVSYALPLSSFCTLFCKSSALIPAGYLSTGGEALVFQFTVSRDLEQIVGALVADSSGVGSVALQIVNPRIELSVVRVQSPAIVASLANLYDGRMQIALPTPSGQPVSVPMQMVLAHKRFVWASTVIPKAPAAVNGSSAHMNLTFSSVNEPSVSAVVLRMRWRPDSSAESRLRRRRAGLYLGGDEPYVILKRLQLIIGDQQVPLSGISDIGATTVKFDPSDANAATLTTKSSGGQASMLFELGRRGLGLFMEDDHSVNLSDVVYDPSILAVNPMGSSQTAGTATTVRPVWGGSLQHVSASNQLSYVNAEQQPMALFIIPLTSFPQLCGDYSDAHTVRSWDLRAVSSFSIQASVQEVNTDPQAVNDYLSQAGAPWTADIVVDGALVCDGMLRLGAGSSDSRYIYTAVQNATVAPTA